LARDRETWFKKRTYHHQEFADIGRLVEMKQRQGLKISVCLPTLNTAGTVGEILRVFRGELMERRPLIDQLCIIDSRSRSAYACRRSTRPRRLARFCGYFAAS